ncbi:sulfatase-like hydrolase/transferase [bacterium]|nr:sulfatase-like hydrolase/transferase [bacterium]
MQTRRQFLKTSLGAAAVTAGCGESATSLFSNAPGNSLPVRPNILLILVDQMRLPPDGYTANQGEAAGVREILRFEKDLSPSNSFTQFFPAMMRLRQNAVVARRHYIASAACAPSRTTFITGQYPSLHGVDQVDGLFKAAEEVTFLDPAGVPTIGDWFQAAGYDPYYFGKWHVSHVNPPYDLTPWGFLGYETSGPEPHGSDPDNLGVYRDPGFSEIVTDFFQNRASKGGNRPWFAVASLVNPHDIAAYPFPWYLPGSAGVTGLTAGFETPQLLPRPGAVSNPDSSGRTVELNPMGFPQNCFDLPPTYAEDLSTKPSCHLESAWKTQVALASIFPQITQPFLPYPFQTLIAGQQAWARAYGQFYVYLQHLVDLELNRLLQAFDQAGLAQNTVVLFTSDHGEYAMAHGQMLQKWYSAYEESVRVPFVVSSPLINPNKNEVLEFNQPTSHIDLAPTLLGLAGFSNSDIAQIKKSISGHTQVRDFVGLNLAPILAAGQSLPRPGVLFTTADDATNLPQGVAQPSKQAQFDSFTKNVEGLIQRGAPLTSGAVTRPNNVHMLCTGVWKLSRYLDPSGTFRDQWELYHLASDPNETTNLLDFSTGQLRGLSVPGLTQNELQAQVDLLKSQLAAQESQLLLKPI